MPCDWYRTSEGAIVHVHRERSGGRKKTCPFCKRYPVEKLCDFPIGHGKTCDAELCNWCAKTIGRQNLEVAPGFTKLNESVDVCPIHKNVPFPKRES